MGIPTPLAPAPHTPFLPMLPARSAGWRGLGSWADISPQVQFLSLFFLLSHALAGFILPWALLL